MDACLGIKAKSELRDWKECCETIKTGTNKTRTDSNVNFQDGCWGIKCYEE